MLRLRDVVELLEGWYPPATAAEWDAVGLVCGEPERPVGSVLLAVDPADHVVDEAVQLAADLLIVHHPLLLKPVHGIAATTPKGRRVHRLVREGIALLTAHTNADVATDGVNDALARTIGIADPQVLLPEDAPEEGGTDKLVTFVPHAEAEQVRAALAAAGAGRIGAYDSASFTGSGEGRFRPLDGANPTIGRVGDLEVVPESRVEVVLPRRLRHQVVEAMLVAHPYEEPAYDIYELAAADPAEPRGHGRIGRLDEPTSLRGFAETVATVLPPTAAGVRVGGDPDRAVQTVAVCAGAGDFMLADVLNEPADVFVTSDLRHHPAGEFLEQDGPALVDVAHWAAEWTWLPLVRDKLAEVVEGGGDTVDIHVSTVCTDPWAFRIDQP